MLFADSSALVKLYSDEVGHEVVRAASDLVVAQLARVEIPAAIWRKQRLRHITTREAQLLTLAFETDYFGSVAGPARFVVVATTAAVLDEAARASAVHGLRAYDAVQLASALSARRADSDCDSMTVFDRGLRTAARREGLELVPPELP
jgi:predicted nucleic acid-binding protein